MGSNLTKEGYAKTIDDMVGSTRPEVDKGPSPQKVHSEWKRLAAFMEGKK